MRYRMNLHKLLAWILLSVGVLFGAIVLFYAGYMQTHDLIRAGVSAVVLTMVVCGVAALVFYKRPDPLAPAEYGDDDNDDDN
jgi:TRAP-type C4-dicarboxylate transport system permease small subunit